MVALVAAGVEIKGRKGRDAHSADAVAMATSRWLRNPTDPKNYAAMVAAVQAWEQGIEQPGEAAGS